MNHLVHRDQVHRDQPSLFDSVPVASVPVVKPSLITDQGKQSRDETYHEVKGNHQHERMKWLTRIIAKGRHGATLDELSAEYGVAPNTFSGRFTELAGLGLVVRTGERRPTRSGSSAAVIVAIDFLKNPPATTPQPEAPAVIANKDFMPGQLTQTSTPHDTHGEMVQPDRVYLVSQRGRAKAVRVRVFDDGGDLYCQEVSAKGHPVLGSRPQRIDEMDAAVSWQLI